jgi:hypothetical protein
MPAAPPDRRRRDHGADETKTEQQEIHAPSPGLHPRPMRLNVRLTRHSPTPTGTAPRMTRRKAESICIIDQRRPRLEGSRPRRPPPPAFKRASRVAPSRDADARPGSFSGGKNQRRPLFAVPWDVVEGSAGCLPVHPSLYLHCSGRHVAAVHNPDLQSPARSDRTKSLRHDGQVRRPLIGEGGTREHCNRDGGDDEAQYGADALQP